MKKSYRLYLWRIIFDRSLFMPLVLLMVIATSNRLCAQSGQFYQLNFNYDGVLTPYSDWGALDLTFTGSSDLLYLNLSRDTAWAIQNMPIQSLENAGVLQTQRIWFPIGLPGVPVLSLNYGLTLTPSLSGRPLITSVATVFQDDVIIYSGAAGVKKGAFVPVPPAINQKGGAAVQPAQQHKGFPNQEAGVNECVPVGISNSLQFLNAKNGLGMKAADIGIPALKGGTGWGPGGCPRPGWVNNKKNYVRNKKLPVTTRKLPGPKNMKNIGAEIAAGQDVEMDIKWQGPGAHCVCITGWVDLGNGKYKVTITHDSKQGQQGGTVSETATYDSNTGTWGGALANGTNDFFFVVECPMTTLRQTSTPQIPYGNGYSEKTHSGTSYMEGQFELKNIMISSVTPTSPPPPLGGTQVSTCNSFFDIEYSIDFGNTFTHFSGPMSFVLRTTHLSDSAGTGTFETEMLSMNLTSGPLMIRESPTLPSLGQTLIMSFQNGFSMGAFFDIFYELSVDGGVSWMPADNGSNLLEMNTQNAVISQLTFNYNGTITPYSDWGAIDLTFPATTTEQYLNLSVDTAWAIENMPVESLENDGLPHTQRFWFRIGTPGVPVGSVMYGYTLTPAIAGKPPLELMAPVEQDSVIIMTGATGGGGGSNHPRAAQKQKGGAVVQPAVSHKGFPNQEAGVNECVPVGISNSLKFLNSKNGLGMKAADIGIPSLKNGTGWGPGGCPRPGWVDNKKNYVKNKKLPITTRKLKGPSGIKNIGAEIKAGQDVEMDIKWQGPGAHCVCVTSWTDLGNGKYKITITHDSKQGKAGGTVSESATYDSNTGTWDGALANGTNDFFFVVECPTTRVHQQTPTVPPTNGSRYKPNSGSQYAGGQIQIQNLVMMNPNPVMPPPPVGSTQFQSYQCIVTLDISDNFGLTFTSVDVPANIVQRLTREPDSLGTMIIETELLILQLQSTSLPGGIMFRESPTMPSTGFITMAPIEGLFEIESFFDVFTEISTDEGMSWMPEDDGGSTLLEVDGPPIPVYREVQNTTVGDGQYECYDATETLFIGGPETPFSVENGGNVTMIAGHSILFMPGSVVHAGGYLDAYITTNGQYCYNDPTLPPTVAMTVAERPALVERSFFRIYPNPVADKFTLELTGEIPPGNSYLEVYSLMGSKVISEILTGNDRYVISLEGQTAGVYLVRIVSGSKTETVKLVKL